ncbi:hypothetical protein JL720_12139 [Aureococcus anophagefferens]|nr:hypothetical protein JL720_12139 [Aureococcus anophagefferens]
MVVSVNVTYYCNAGTQFMTLKPCAERVVATVLANFEFHYYQGHVTPQKEITTCDRRRLRRRERLFRPDVRVERVDGTGQLHHVPTLDTHLKLWGSSGVSYLGRRYTDADGAVVYSARVVPGSGHVVELRPAPRR